MSIPLSRERRHLFSPALWLVMLLAALALGLGLSWGGWAAAASRAQPDGAVESVGPVAAPVPSSTPWFGPIQSDVDTYVSSGLPNQNYGTLTRMYVSYTGDVPVEEHALIWFNLSSIPKGGQIKSVTFKAYLATSTGASSVTLSLCRANAAWTEGGVTWNTRPSCTARATAPVGSSAGWYSWNAFNLFQDWYTGGDTNYGVCLTGPVGGVVYTRGFSTSDGGVSPCLEVTYYPPTPTPTRTRTRTRTPTATRTTTRTATLVPSSTSTRTPTPSSTPTASATRTPTSPPFADPYEPNDTFASAALIQPGATVEAQACGGDVDYYRFVVSAGDAISLTLGAAPVTSEPAVQARALVPRYEVALIDPNGVVVQRAVGGDGGLQWLHTHAMLSGQYRASVSATSDDDCSHTYVMGASLGRLIPHTLNAVADAYVLSTTPDSNHGTEQRVTLEREMAGSSRGLFRFDLSAIAATTISSAVFEVTLEAAGDGYPSLELWQPTEPWTESGVTWSNQPDAVDTGVSSPAGNRRRTVFRIDVTDIVQSWLTGGVDNYGFELRATGPVTVTHFRRSFISRESILGSPPRLVIRMSGGGGGGGGGTGSIGGRVLHDASNCGTYDPGEEAPGVVVQLSRYDDNSFLAIQTTGADGTYAFAGLEAGAYATLADWTSLPEGYSLIDAWADRVEIAEGEVVTNSNFRIEPADPRGTGDLAAQEVEFLQVLDGEPLIAGKPTIARVYVSSTGTDGGIIGVSGRLYCGYDWVAPVENVSVSPNDDPENDPEIISDMEETVNFLLPSSWTEPDACPVLEAWINPDYPEKECESCWGANNHHRQSGIVFHESSPFNVTLVSVTLNGEPPDEAPDDLTDYLLRIFPIRAVNISTAEASVDTEESFEMSAGGGCGAGWGEILDTLEEMIEAPDMYYYGLVPPCSASVAGCGQRPGQVAAGVVSDSIWRTGEDVTMAHEVGHNLGFRHTCACGEAGCEAQHPDAAIGVYGVDLSDPSEPRYLSPTGYRDLMSYCSQRWPSDITYEALRAIFSPSTVSAADAAPGLYLVASGAVQDGVVTLTRPYYQETNPPGASDAAGTGRYAIELRDAASTPLFTRWFDTVGDSADPDNGTGHFRQIVPWVAGTHSVAIRDGAAVLHVTPVSPNPPEVELLSPNGGESWLAFGRYPVSWSAHDDDDDPMRFRLEYSADDGATWQTVASDLTGASWEVDAGALPGSATARLRLVASDGVNTTRVASDASFRVGDKPPTVWLISPDGGAELLPGDLVQLQGYATDLEDGPITEDARFRWSSDRQGFLGAGRTLMTVDLLPGTHVLTLEVTDGDAFVGRQSVKVYVGYRLRFPVVGVGVE